MPERSYCDWEHKWGLGITHDVLHVWNSRICRYGRGNWQRVAAWATGLAPDGGGQNGRNLAPVRTPDFSEYLVAMTIRERLKLGIRSRVNFL